MIAQRVLTDRSMFEEWEERYHVAQRALEGRVEKVEACQDELERNLTMVGVNKMIQDEPTLYCCLYLLPVLLY